MSDVSSFGSLLPEEPAGQTAYRVLARKYRPNSFADLIGQEAMVRTLTNAFTLGRIHQAYLLSGVRGVGKTTTARILARALNYQTTAAGDRPPIDVPTIAMAGLGLHCQAIIDSRHVDVIEMDAASHTGIDDIREIIDGSRYRPVMARHKVYIIDEVHMLSKAAFNGLLKTLEEPPAHVKFLFATTEADKIPVTVRSRCQRFDLRRIEAPVMMAHLQAICAREGIAMAPEAAALVARAAEGSVRDALSLLDQAIAHGAASGSAGIAAETVRLMLGLADGGRVIDLLEAVLRGDIATALTELRALYDAGADPLGLVTALADLVHLVTRLKLVPEAARDTALTEEERRRGQEFARRLSVPVLSRAWQILTKGIEEVRLASRPIAAADMVLVRLAHVADLPTPDEAIRRLGALATEGDGAPPSPSAEVRPRASAPVGARPALHAGSAMALQPSVAPDPPPGPATLDAVLALAERHRDIWLQTHVERDVRLVRLEPGLIEFEAAPGAPADLAGRLMRRLAEWTGRRWVVSIAASGGAPTLRDRRLAEDERRLQGLATHPVVARILDLFPGGRILPPATAATAAAAADEPIADEEGEGFGPPPAPFDEEIGYLRDSGPDDSDPDDL